jgi:hypothetical protein
MEVDEDVHGPELLLEAAVDVAHGLRLGGDVPAGAGARAREVLGRRHVVEVRVEVAAAVEAAGLLVVVPGRVDTLESRGVPDDVVPGAVVLALVERGAFPSSSSRPSRGERRPKNSRLHRPLQASCTANSRTARSRHGSPTGRARRVAASEMPMSV